MAEREKQFIEVTPDEYSLLDYYRKHKDQDTLIVRSPFDIGLDFSYITFDPFERKYIEMENQDTIKKNEALKFLLTFIAMNEGVSVDEVTPEYLERIQKRSEEELKEDQAARRTKWEQELKEDAEILGEELEYPARQIAPS